MKSGIYMTVIILIVSVIYFTTCSKAGIWLVKEEAPVHADAMVILMGSIADRVLQAVDIYRHGLAEKVIIVEESMGAYKALEARGASIISKTEQVRDAIVSLGITADNIIILPGDATSTQMEAIIIRNYLTNESCIDTILLVSSAPHTLRASMIFKSAFRKAGIPVYVVCSPSVYTDFKAEKWWRTKEGIQTVLTEYVKIANFILFEKRELKQVRD
jgi:uncharacterized SAM-binding protein YcdF (DUF218 family)